MGFDRAGVPPRQARIKLAVDLVTVTAFLCRQLLWDTAVQLHLILRAQALQHDIEAVRRPGELLTDAVDGYHLVSVSEPVCNFAPIVAVIFALYLA